MSEPPTVPRRKLSEDFIPLYFYLTRNREGRMTVAEMKKAFKCGADLIGKVRRAIVEKTAPVAASKRCQPGEGQPGAGPVGGYHHARKRWLLG